MEKTITLSPQEVAARNRLFRHYVEPRIDMVRCHVERLMQPGDDADEYLQEMLVYLLEVLGSFDASKSSIDTWLCLVVRHRMATLHDRRHRERVAQAAYLEVVGPDVYRMAPPLSLDVEDYPRTFSTLMALSPLQRRILLMTAEGWTVPDIADELQTTDSAVSAALYRARQHFAPFAASAHS